MLFLSSQPQLEEFDLLLDGFIFDDVEEDLGEEVFVVFEVVVFFVVAITCSLLLLKLF